jgi:hypothetical protein
VQVWNEQNNGGFWKLPVDDTAIDTYVQMLQAAYKAIKAANPSVPVISGGLAPYGDMTNPSHDPQVPFQAPLNYLAKMLGHPQFASSFDGLGFETLLLRV